MKTAVRKKAPHEADRKKVFRPTVPHDQMVYMLLKNAQRAFGKSRFEIGVLLNEIKEQGYWKGRASSFGAFLEEERINSSAAYQYMRVTKKLFGDMKFTDREFEKISTANMGNLELACQVICEDNKGELMDILTALGERDARQELLERLDVFQPLMTNNVTPKVKRSQQVNRVLNSFFDLPDDQRIEFLEAIKKHPAEPSN